MNLEKIADLISYIGKDGDAEIAEKIYKYFAANQNPDLAVDEVESETAWIEERADKYIEQFIDSIDYTQLHRDKFKDYGMQIWFDHSGKPTYQTSGTYPNPYARTDVFFQTTAWGNNYDTSYYSEGWTTEEKDEHDNGTGNYINDDTGKVMTRDDMISECIDDGDHSDMYEDWKDAIKREFIETVY